MKSGSGAPGAAPDAVLYAVTRPLAQVPSLDDLIGQADPRHPLVWTRGDRGCVGVGEALRLHFSGPSRFADAAEAWRAISARAVIDDPVRMPGSGLVAFGSFAFADEAAGVDAPGARTDRDGEAEGTVSALIVPRILIARHRGTAWITEIGFAPFEHAPVLPSPAAPGAWAGAELPIDDADPSYLAGVREATSRIDRGEAEKIVLARQVRGSIPASDDLRVPLLRLAGRYDDCWTYAVDGMIGASPETLIRRTDGAISGRVLAGTRGRKPEDPAADARARDDLLTSAKEQHEHAFAVQSVITALSPHVRELHTSEEPFALRLPNVWHLATELGAVPGDQGSSLELAAALHPTAAVAGTPTAAAVEAIAELEPAGRGRYAGPVGWIDAAGEGEWVIALRCAEVGPGLDRPAGDGPDRSGADPDAPAHASADEDAVDTATARTVTAYAGGGIVAGSDPAHEFGETVSKFAPIAEAFAP
ncbi:isochorismate synthase MenF [Leucobacter soli]|uniref:Isochorismate synthase MenF n=1 Tax=Leucobacter soli TaxID=2812850 RepID=A0A916NIB3_9MICO|nr:chorismate-binding protein [Leucobacter soli]CAG7615567.1 Isochorismate synthase MenF [Leucobacter soli]